jgi:hypothetical protein
LERVPCVCEHGCVLDGVHFSGKLASGLFWGFDVLSQSHDALRRYAIDMFLSLGLVEEFGMDVCRIGNFVRRYVLWKHEGLRKSKLDFLMNGTLFDPGIKKCSIDSILQPTFHFTTI